MIEIWAATTFDGKEYRLVATVDKAIWQHMPDVREMKRDEMKAELARAIADELEVEYTTVSVDGPFRTTID